MVGGLLAQTSVRADAAGYRRLLEFAQAQVPGRCCWAVEGAGRYGAGLAVFLQAGGERVVEVGRPKRPRGAPGPGATPWTPSARPERHSRRIQLLAAEADELRAELERLVAAVAPWLLELPAVGPISAAQVLVSWSHAGGCARSPRSLPWLQPTRSRPPPGR
jgi:transposase